MISNSRDSNTSRCVCRATQSQRSGAADDVVFQYTCPTLRDMSFRRLPFLGLSVFLLLLIPWIALGANNKPIKVVLRYDDYLPCYSNAAEIKVADQYYSKIVDQHVVEMARQYNIAISIGVIPFPQGGTFNLGQSCSETIPAGVSRKRIEIAQHGYSHGLYRVTNNHVNSEFVGRPYSEQISIIKDGKHALEQAYGIQVMSFIPPWNSYDRTTVGALKKLGFKILSSDMRVGPGWTADIPKSVPVTCELKNIHLAIDRAREQAQLTNGDIFIVCLFHSYDFLEVDKNHGCLTIKSSESLFAWLTAQPDIETLTLSEAADQAGYFNGSKQTALARLYSIRMLLPSFLQPDLGYLKWTIPYNADLEPLLKSQIIRIVLFTLFLFSVTLVFTITITRIIRTNRPALSKFLTWLSIVLALILSLYGFENKSFNVFRLIAVSISAGILGGQLSLAVFNRFKTGKWINNTISDLNKRC